jgi:hypothetical protein
VKTYVIHKDLQNQLEQSYTGFCEKWQITGHHRKHNHVLIVAYTMPLNIHRILSCRELFRKCKNEDKICIALRERLREA